MKREELEELHYIAPIVNVPSILIRGILSHNGAKKIKHESCASQAIQERRERVVVPSGRPLHDYANLYFNARNPMMHLIKEKHDELTILALRPNVIDLTGTIITDCNAARGCALFKPAPSGLDVVDRDRVFAEFWTHPNPIEQDEHKGEMCAEVLVPDKVDARYIFKAYVSCNQSREALITTIGTQKVNIEIAIKGYLFFR